MAKLPVRKLPGVGKVNDQILSGLGIVSCRDTLEHAIEININFTENAFDFLMRSSMGIARNYHEEMGIKKSVNASETFAVLTSHDDLLAKLRTVT